MALISKWTIKDFKAIREEVVRIEPGARVVGFRGPNGIGKTSRLEAFLAAFRGIDQDRVRPGADSSEVMVEMTDLTEIRRRRNAKGQTTSVRRGPAREPEDPPGEFIENLLGGAVMEPLKLLDAGRLETALLEALGIKVDQAAVAARLGESVENLPNLDWSGEAAEVLDRVRSVYEDRRKEAGRLRKQKEAVLKDAASHLPPERPAPDYSGEDVDADERAALDRSSVERAKESALAGMRKRLKVVDQGREESANRIAELEDQLARARSSLASYEEEAGKLRDMIRTGEPDAAVLAVAEATIAACKERRAALRQHESDENQREAVRIIREETDAARAAHEALDAKVKAVGRGYLAELVAKAPSVIPGLRHDGECFRVGDVPVDQLSSGQKIRLAVKIAKARNPGLKIIAVDGLEKLDPDNLEALREEIEEDESWTFVYTETAAEAEVVGAEVEVRA